MTINNAIMTMSGMMILVGLGLGHFMGQIDISQTSWLWLVAFVGINLFQMGFTGFCPAKIVFKAMGMKESNDKCCS